MLEIDSKGMVNSQRKAEDGITYFGSQSPKEGVHANDFMIPEESSALGLKHFKIFYSAKDDEYYLQDMGEGTGTFVRLDQKMVYSIL